ncbi:MAG: hypothetical protein M3257_08525 [Actinomycetota bacterium]|nr:hypothetical protein [Actinomycetota bacterium]
MPPPRPEIARMVLQVSAAATTADPALHGQPETLHEQLRARLGRSAAAIPLYVPAAMERAARPPRGTCRGGGGTATDVE